MQNNKSFGELFFGGLMGGNPVPVSDSELLADLLAVIHGDGGHYQQDNGTEKAVRDAIEKVFEMKSRLTPVAPDECPLGGRHEWSSSIPVCLKCGTRR